MTEKATTVGSQTNGIALRSAPANGQSTAMYRSNVLVLALPATTVDKRERYTCLVSSREPSTTGANTESLRCGTVTNR